MGFEEEQNRAEGWIVDGAAGADEDDGFTLLEHSEEGTSSSSQVARGSIPSERVLQDYESTKTASEEKIDRLERENEDLIRRLAALEALVFRGDGERSAFLTRLSDRLGEVDRWILQHERARNNLIRRQVPCGFVPDHTFGNGVSPFTELGPLGLLTPLFSG